MDQHSAQGTDSTLQIKASPYSGGLQVPQPPKGKTMQYYSHKVSTSVAPPSPYGNDYQTRQTHQHETMQYNTHRMPTLTAQPSPYSVSDRMAHTPQHQTMQYHSHQVPSSVAHQVQLQQMQIAQAATALQPNTQMMVQPALTQQSPSQSPAYKSSYSSSPSVKGSAKSSPKKTAPLKTFQPKFGPVDRPPLCVSFEYQSTPWAEPPPAEYNIHNASQGHVGQPPQATTAWSHPNQIAQASRTIQSIPIYSGAGFHSSNAITQPVPAVRNAGIESYFNTAHQPFNAYSVRAARGYHTQTPHMPPLPNAVYANQTPQSPQSSYHPSIMASRAESLKQIEAKPATEKFTTKLDSRKLTRTTPLPYQPVLAVSSQPGFSPADVDADGNVRKRRTLNQVIFCTVASDDHCMTCKVRFGQENPHGAYSEYVKQTGQKPTWVEINNLGAVEIPVRLPCGHVAGNNCILPYAFCPKCQGPLQYSDCGHKIPLLTTSSTAMGMKATIAKRCLQCRVFDYEENANLSGLLAQLGTLKAERADLLCQEGQQERVLERHHLDKAIAQIQQKVDYIEAKTNEMVQAAQFSGYY